MTRSIYRTPEGREQVRRLYLEALERFPVPVSRSTLETSHGTTHVLAIGQEDGRPVVVFQGGNFLNPLSLEWFVPLAHRYRLYAPDTVGHPGFSAESRLSPRDLSYGRWAEEVLDGLGLDRAAVVAPSFGAGIALRLAAVAPERIVAAALLVPSGLIAPPVLRLLNRIVAPMLAYMLRPSATRLYRAARPMFTLEPDPAWLAATRASFDHVRLETGMPRPATAGELAEFEAPTLVVAAERDPFFPGAAVAIQTSKVLPGAHIELLEGEAHVLSDGALGRVNGLVLELLDSVHEGDSGSSLLKGAGVRS